MSEFDEKTINKLKRLERDIERLKVGEKAKPDGWTPVTGTFSYKTASTINISAGGASVYSIGDRLKWVTATGSTQRYGTVVGIADTVLTVAVNTDHVLANEAWTLPYYSHQVNPVGFPDVFNIAAPPVAVAYYDNGSGGQPAVQKARFWIHGRQCTVHVETTGVKVGLGGDIAAIASTAFPPINKAAYSTTWASVGSAVLLAPTTLSTFVAYYATYDIFLISSSKDPLADNQALSLSWIMTYEL